MSAVAQSAAPRTLFYPALYLGVYPNLREALAAMRYPADQADDFIARNEGLQTLVHPPGRPEVQALLAPKPGGRAEMCYLFGAGFEDADKAAEEVAALCANVVVNRGPEHMALHCLHVVQRVIGAVGGTQ